METLATLIPYSWAIVTMYRYAENDRLKILELEDRKKIQHLLGLTQPVEYESTYFRAPGEPAMIQSLAQHTGGGDPVVAASVGGSGRNKAATISKKKRIQRGNDMLPSDELTDRERNETLLLTVEALKAQLEDHTRLANEKTAGLLEDRRIREEEARATADRSAEQIKELTDKLHNTQDLLYDSTRDYLELKFEQRTRERLWTEEKERLLVRIEELKDDLDGQQSELRRMAVAAEALQVERDQEGELARLTHDAGTNAYLPGGRSEVGVGGGDSRRGGAASGAASSVGDAPSTTADHQESLAEMYREQCIKLEDELCRFREQKAAAGEIAGGRNDKLLKRLAVMKSRYEALEQRRGLEAEGYKNAMKILRKKLSTVEHQLYRLATQSHGDDAEVAMLRDVGVAAARSKKALGGVQHLKSQIYQLEHDIKASHGTRTTTIRGGV
jgi:coiled-coil domain-containing protein 77